MKRDMDLIRELMFQLEGVEKVELSEYDEEQVGFHRHLLIEANLAHGSSSHVVGDSYPTGMCYRLTWEGYEFIDSVRNETLWNKAKQKVVTGVTTASMEMIKQTVGFLAKQAIGILH